MWWQRRRDDQEPEGTADDEALIAETEAFLSGRLVQLWHDEWLMVPGWGWLTVLAHGGRAEIAALKDSGTYWSPSERQWSAALGFLASEVLARAPTPAALLDLQRTAIIPLELEMLKARAAVTMEPSQIVRQVLNAVADAHPSNL